ncbi:hypothetical protein BD289DRAFT_457935 [Coniella lustricola]|uniref:Uncharacterized protein n=1 Tax=Coniella lustricola TaxID=2025994 RepID=A0A2T3ALN9_9PEZI|nr:hypothetical protein BD289DRAFT_457935 [Coniella lustricola]
MHLRLSSTLVNSITQGPDLPALLNHTIVDNLAKIVSEYGDRPSVIAREASPSANNGAKETTLTYATLDASSSALALSLRTLGVKKGDRVAISLGNTVEHATLTYAIFKLGAILVPLNPAFNDSQVGAALSHLEVEVLIIGAVTDRAYKPCQGRNNLELLRQLVPDLNSGRIESPSVSTLKRIVVFDNTASHPSVDFKVQQYSSLIPYSTLDSSASLSSSSSVTLDAPLQPSDTINIQFTSGTTSQPKAAMLTHTNILNNGYLIGKRMGLRPSDLIVCPPPLFHCFGCVLGYMATATSGAAILFPSPAFDPVASLRMALDHRATGLYGVATMFFSMLELMEKSGPKSKFTKEEICQLPTHLKKGIAAGSSVPESLMLKLYENLGLNELVICYGMTETSPVSCMTAPDDPIEKRTGTIGKVMPHTRVKIVDPGDRSKVLPIGERGELAASGYLVMQGYWGDEEKTKEVLILESDTEPARMETSVGEPAVADDAQAARWWMYSGDEASMSADGYVTITGRIKDLIIRGGENIHPLEIENVLFQHPLIAEASVVGVPDKKLGEAVCAFIVARAGVATEDDPTFGEDGFAVSESQGQPLLRKDDVRAWVLSHLSKHMVPKYIFWTDDYPKTASGKIQKYKLRDAAKDLIHIHTGKGDLDEKYEALLDRQVGKRKSGSSW